MMIFLEFLTENDNIKDYAQSCSLCERMPRPHTAAIPRQFAEEVLNCHCEERFSRRGSLEVVIDYQRTEIASLCSQKRQKDFFRDLLAYHTRCELGSLTEFTAAGENR